MQTSKRILSSKQLQIAEGMEMNLKRRSEKVNDTRLPKNVCPCRSGN
jgi:hypothetical protein